MFGERKGVAISRHLSFILWENKIKQNKRQTKKTTCKHMKYVYIRENIIDILRSLWCIGVYSLEMNHCDKKHGGKKYFSYDWKHWYDNLICLNKILRLKQNPRDTNDVLIERMKALPSSQSNMGIY